uniref:non-specific serine/threonine protein kinase n=1 Tax=Elaeophora elaphi TaxID=1147741 RepID=A0A0R3S4B0_9BILA
LIVYCCSKKKEIVRVGNYSIGKTIGRGNFAVVHVAKHGISSKKVALKIVDKSQLLADDLSKIEREINILKNLDHPHIVKLYEIINTDQFLYVVMEYASNGELFELLMKRGHVTENEARRLFQQISAAVAYCHARGVVHRDLKAENLLLDANNDIKLIDFGFSNIQKPQSLLTTFCGSPPYTAPELLLGKAYDGRKADVWSLGVVLYVLLTGGFPFPGEITELKTAIFSEQLRIPYWISFACADLIHKMLAFHPAKRINITNVIQHRSVAHLIMHDLHEKLMNFIIHLEETPDHLNPSVVLFIQQHTKWTEDQIAEVYFKNFCSPIYGTYQLLCSNIEESYTDDKSSSQLRRGSRGSIFSGKVNTEVQTSIISAHQFARLTLSVVDNSESDKSDASDPDEAKLCCNWAQYHNTQYNPALISNSAEVRRYSLYAENLLPLKSLLFAQQQVCTSQALCSEYEVVFSENYEIRSSEVYV